jgi:arsenate reductase
MQKSVKMYGIKNCDTVRKAIKWLNEKAIDSTFYDLKKESLDDKLIIEWLESVDKDKLINKRGLTWRKLPDEEKQLDSTKAIISLIKTNPTVLKRPVLFNGDFWSVGFNADDWNDLFL